MAFKNVKEIVDAELSGQSHEFGYRKVILTSPTSTVWFDLSMVTGNPVPNYYANAPLASVAMRQSTDGGVYHGGNVSPADKYLKQLTMMLSNSAGNNCTLMLLDYLLYYPFCDDGGGVGIAQSLTNSVTLPRYTDGKGVQIMAVTTASRTGGQSFVVTYTNSDGVGGRVTASVQQNTATAVGSIVSNLVANGAGSAPASNSPFLPLQAGDTGVRSIESITMLGDDVGLFTLALVKPITQLTLGTVPAITEVDFAIDRGFSMPKIVDDAYLNFILLTTGSMNTGAWLGTLKTVWK